MYPFLLCKIDVYFDLCLGHCYLDFSHMQLNLILNTREEKNGGSKIG